MLRVLRKARRAENARGGRWRAGRPSRVCFYSVESLRGRPVRVERPRREAGVSIGRERDAGRVYEQASHKLSTVRLFKKLQSRHERVYSGSNSLSRVDEEVFEEFEGRVKL